MSEKFFQIAIDGPVGSGKSTVTRLVAQRLGFLYVDTGAMYRVVALLGKRRGADFADEAAIAALLHETRIGLLPPTPEQKDGRLITVLVNGEDVSWQIRSVEVSKLVPQVAAMPTVRQKLVILQQEMARTNNVVMEGRDITYRVLPNANLKIYLTASDEVRALRRHEQLLQKGEEVALSDVAADLHSRDEMDMQRITDPLKIVAGAWVLDTSTLTIDQVVDLICEKARSLMET